MIVPIKSIHDLRNEIVRLETLNVQQKESIKQRFSSPKIIYKTFMSLFPNSSEDGDGKSSKTTGLLNQDIVGMISKFLLPLTLNKTLFKGSGFITRSVVTFLSKKASGYINQDTVTSGWGKFKDILSKVKLPDNKGTRIYKTPKSQLPVVITPIK